MTNTIETSVERDYTELIEKEGNLLDIMPHHGIIRFDDHSLSEMEIYPYIQSVQKLLQNSGILAPFHHDSRFIEYERVK